MNEDEIGLKREKEAERGHQPGGGEQAHNQEEGSEHLPHGGP